MLLILVPLVADDLLISLLFIFIDGLSTTLFFVERLATPIVEVTAGFFSRGI